MALAHRERILILAKTYPSPSAKHMETSCVAGINDRGEMRRLYPVPFRLLEQQQKFSKWQWIDCGVSKAAADHRPESYNLDVGTTSASGILLPTDKWQERRTWIEKIPDFTTFDGLQEARRTTCRSLALIRPKHVLELEVQKAKNPDWTPDELQRLTCAQTQDNLFDSAKTALADRPLRKVPFDFYYHYTVAGPDGQDTRQRHKIVDWEVGALFWNTRKAHGPGGWEAKMRSKLADDLLKKDLMFLLGNQHRFQDQWLIISLIYPPMQPPTDRLQTRLF